MATFTHERAFEYSKDVYLKEFFQKKGPWLFIGLPIASLALNAVFWLRYGVDLPFFDDWRGYASGQIHSLNLHYLFIPANDTLYPVGLVLDALAQRFLDGNSVAYQFLSMVSVLGALLFLQWRLLVRALGDYWLAAACFVFTLLMLQPGSYWGRENMAYHQAVPLVFILLCLNLLLSDSAKNIWRLLFICALSLVAGFTYISGAFGVLTVGASLLLASLALRGSNLRKTLFSGGVVMLLSGIFSSTIQYVSAVQIKTRSSDFPLALPTELDFWFYFLGKIGRSLALPQASPIFSMVFALGVCTVVLLLVLGFAVRKKAAHFESDQYVRVWVVFFSIAAVVFVYLSLISVGRANLRPPEVRTGAEIFAFGFQRFHFFWATLLWPWLIAALIVTWQALQKRFFPTRQANLTMGLTAGVLVSAIAMIGGGVLDHAGQHERDASYRISTIECFANELQRGDAIHCQEFGRHDMRAAYSYAQRTGASFVKYFPILQVPLGGNESPPWFIWTRDKAAATMHNMNSAASGTPFWVAKSDAQIWLETNHKREMAKCTLLEVSVLIQTQQPDIAQMFYRSRGNSDFSESESVQFAIAPNKPERLNFRLASSRGFEDALRFDPVTYEQSFQLLELEVRCLLSMAYK